MVILELSFEGLDILIKWLVWQAPSENPTYSPFITMTNSALDLLKNEPLKDDCS